MASIQQLSNIFLTVGESRLNAAVGSLDLSGQERNLAPTTPKEIRVLISSEQMDLNMEQNLTRAVKTILEIWNRPDHSLIIAQSYFGIIEVLVARYILLRRLFTAVLDLNASNFDEHRLTNIFSQHKQILSLRSSTIVLNQILFDSQNEALESFLEELASERAVIGRKFRAQYSRAAVQKLLEMLNIAAGMRELLLKDNENVRQQLVRSEMDNCEDLSAFGPHRVDNALILIEPLKKAFRDLLPD